MTSGASESPREARRDYRVAPSAVGPLTRLELVLVVEGLVASVLGARGVEGNDDPSRAAWAITLGAGAVLVPCGLARTPRGVAIAPHGMAAALTLLALFMDSATSGAFPLVPHLIVIALLVAGHRDPMLVAVVGLVAGVGVLAHAAWQIDEPPMLPPQDAAWLAASLCLVAVLTGHLRALREALVVEQETVRRRWAEVRTRTAADDAHDAVDAEGAAAEQTQWLAGLSHELRTPLHAVVGFLELLSRSALSEDQHRHVEGANTSARHVLGLVADVLETAKIESGALELEREPFDVRSVVREAVRLVEGSARERALSLELALGDDLATQLAGDPLRLRQILINLLGNAVKYARSRVVVRAVWIGESDALQIDVEDDGPGIPEGKVHRVFQPYRQADRGTARRHGGTGLGLSISRRLARLMRGDVLVRSTSSSGTTFRFFAPLPRADVTTARSTAQHAAQAPVVPLRVLLADDDASNRLVTSELLRLLGHAVTQTEDGEQALEHALQGRHDLVVLDVEMPGLSGPEVARRVRAAGNQVAIIALTGHGGREGRLTYLRAGMDAVVVKPADLVHLGDAIASAFASRALLPGDERRADARPPVERALTRGTASQEVMRELGSGLDLDDLHHRVGGDEQLATAVLAAVRDESERLFGDLSAAARRGDVEAMRVVAHTLKGCVANVGARPVREAVTAVENAAKSGEHQRAIELAAHALALGTSLSAALAHACGAAAQQVEREGVE